MPAYDSQNFRPPAPVALVTLRFPTSGTTVSNVPMLLDTGADVSLVPRTAIANVGYVSDAEYELEAFDGRRTVSPAIQLEMQFLKVDAGEAESREELFDLWRLEHPTLEEQAEVHAAIQQGLADIEAGRYRPAADVSREMRKEYNLPE